jgi:S1-C subfamily serine protease
VPPNDIASLLRAQLTDYISAQFPATTQPETIRAAVLAHPGLASIDRGDLESALDAILAGRGAEPAAAHVRPRLLVDWGELPQIGRSARPLFSLIGPGTADKPTVRVAVDRGLDNDPADPLRQVRTEESGLWTFYVPFSLTTGGLDARAGLYVIDVDVTFPHADDGRPRFLRTQIRLNIPDGSSDRRELVIDGDGQSVVNLAGHDLRSFSRVVLKGDDKSIINLQNFSQQMAAVPEAPKEPVVFEYELKVNRDIHERLPSVVPVARPTKADAVSLAVDGRRIHVIARKRATFGRSRENDVCLRFLPRSTKHDEGSRAISRTHMALDLTDDGLVLSDESTKGVDVDCDPVKGDKTFTYLDAHGGRHLDLPSPLSAEQVLEMDLTMFARDPEDPDFRSDIGWDDVCFEVAGEPASRLWQVARGSGIEAARVRRLNNLPDEEYVFLFRHATIGKSAKDHAIALPGLGPAVAELRLLYAGRMFWLHSGGRVPLSLDGRRIDGACLIPLALGQSISIGGSTLRVGKLAQLEIDDDGSIAPEVPPPATDGHNSAGSIGEVPTGRPTPLAAHAPSPGAIPPPPPPVVALRAGAVPPPPPPPQRSAGAAPGGVAGRSTTDPIQRALESVAVIACRFGHGSAFVAAPGVLVTNYHVIADDAVEDLQALFFDPLTHAAAGFRVALIAEDPEHDLAFLRTDAPAPPLATSGTFRHQNGHKVAVIGSPGVGAGGARLENIVTDGRLGPVFSSDFAPDRWSLSIALNPGNSGGPVLDAATAEVLGVTVAKFTTAEGLALAVPHDVVMAGLERAASASAAEAARADSQHRQRHSLRQLAGFTAAATAALEQCAMDSDEEGGDISSVLGDSLVSRQAGVFSRDLAAAIDGLGEQLVPSLERLRDDPLCPAVVRQDLLEGWRQLDLLARRLRSGPGGGGGQLLERVAATLRDLEGVCEGVRVEIDCSLSSGKSVYDAADKPSSGLSLALQAVAAAPGVGAPGADVVAPLGRWFAGPQTRPRYLTKSRFALACTCPTKLFYTAKPGEYANEWQSDPFMESLANEGNRVGALARLYFPGGVLVDTLDHADALRQTDELLARPEVTIFEAAVRHGDLFIRADILRKTLTGIELYEVKSKGYSADDDGDFTTSSGIAAAWLSYVRDVAFQRHVVTRAFPGPPVRAFLFLPDTSRRATTDELAAKAAAAVDDSKVSLSDEALRSPIMRAVRVDHVCDRVVGDRYTLGDRSLTFEDYVAELAALYRDDRKLQAPLSLACLGCEFDASPFALAVGEKSGKRECWSDLLGWTADDFEKPQAFEICGLSPALKKTFLVERRLHMAEVRQSDIEPEDDGKPGLSRSQRQWLQVTKCVNQDRASHIDRQNLRGEMAGWRYPLHLIDFETCRAAIPFHAGSRPLELMAFQFSHHIMHADGRVEHAGEFLCTQKGASPNAAFVAALREQIGSDDGTILHYAPHEVSTLRAIAGQLRARQGEVPDAAGLLAFIDGIAPAGDRQPIRQVVDLCHLVRRFYYAPSMGGSNSIKEVLPAILRESEFLRKKYSRPIYGARGGIPSCNFTDMAWVDQADGRVRDPYQLLPPIDEEASPAVAGGKYLKLVRNGGAAMQAYADLVLYDWTDDRRKAVRQALLRYCELDTLAMVFIVEAWRDWCG